jgi:alkanesulfonate monooxygenase SsuD/methylene tetrahydromethanopterin reductase-like flavin-dependent oxidoreductase (luciferase family)
MALMTRIGFAIQVGAPESAVRSAAVAAQRVGFDSFWTNNPPGKDGVGLIAVAARVTDSIALGTAVVPISHNQPAELRARLDALALPRSRYRLGLGSGAGPDAVRRMREALGELRPSGFPLAVGALGPRMLRLGGEAADGVVLSTLTPAYARKSAGLVREASERAGRPTPPVLAVVVIGYGPGAGERVEGAARFMATLPQCQAHFARMGATARDTYAIAQGAEALAATLASWRDIVDEVIVTPMLPPEQPDLALEALDALHSAWRSG